MRLVTKFLPKIILFSCLFIAAITAFWLPINADEPTAVDISYFHAVPLDNAVRLDWETGSESNTLAFRIKRGAPDDNAIYLDYVGDNGYIWSVGGVAVGSTYSVTDDQVQNGETYTYILVEVETSGNEIEQGQETVTVGIPPTNTPVVISNPGNNSATQTPTATTAAGSSTKAAPTPTTQSGNQKPTNTPSGFATITPNATNSTVTPAPNTNQRDNSSITTSSSTNSSAETSSVNIGGAAEVSAQEETTGEKELAPQTSLLLAPENQDDYPGDDPTATAVSDSSGIYPENNTTNENTSDEVSSTSVPVIGSTDGYAGLQSGDPTNNSSSGNTSAKQGRMFLWIGFIVALLIFATGIVGSILLFTRKSN
jgi:hypothetical protein